MLWTLLTELKLKWERRKCLRKHSQVPGGKQLLLGCLFQKLAASKMITDEILLKARAGIYSFLLRSIWYFIWKNWCFLALLCWDRFVILIHIFFRRIKKKKWVICIWEHEFLCPEHWISDGLKVVDCNMQRAYGSCGSVSLSFKLLNPIKREARSKSCVFLVFSLWECNYHDWHKNCIKSWVKKEVGSVAVLGGCWSTELCFL